ncbi:MAG: VOC family protein [Planctomycetota bacterium]|nr:VOC family protein [Planctomycetota bacterium]
MKISHASVFVDDQSKALAFYTDVLGFVLKQDIPMGEARWLTVVSSDSPDGVELLLEPNSFLPAQIFQQALREAGIPATTFEVADTKAEHDRLVSLGVVFTTPPTEAGPTVIAAFKDTCGNLIQMHQV